LESRSAEGADRVGADQRIDAGAIAVRDVVHGRTVFNTDALANPEALLLFRNLPELRN